MNPLLYAKLAAALALGAALVYGGYHVADLKGKVALESLQHAWDVDKAAIQKVADDAIAQATKERDTALAANQGIQNDLQTQIDSIRGLNGSLADRLRNLAANSAADSSAMQKACGNTDAVTAAANARLGQASDAIAAALTECAVNTANYKALIAEIKPQL